MEKWQVANSEWYYWFCPENTMVCTTLKRQY
jgi:hypothetical protein